MNAAVAIGLPLLVMVAMTIVGLELTVADLARVMHDPARIGVALLVAIVVLPLIGAGVIVLWRPAPAVAGGLILVATAPQAMSSNLFCLMGRANVALSVTLTAASSLLAVAATPFAAALAFELLMEQRDGFVLPPGEVMRQVFMGLVLPVGIGMLVRHRAPGFVERNRKLTQRLTIAAIIAILGVIVADQAATIRHHLPAIMATGALFTLGAAALGVGVARTLSWSKAETVTLLAAYPTRSLSVATLIAVNVLGRPDFLAFAASFYVLQAVLLVPAMLVARRSTSER